MSNPELSPQAQDALGEFMNIGAANAATSLSKMLGHTIDVAPPRVELREIEDVTEFIAAPGDVRSIVLLKILGDAPGVMLLLFSPEDAKTIAHAVTHHEDQALMDDADRSALCEVGNILAGSSFSSLGRFLDLNFSHTIPNAATDMVGALLSSILADFGSEHDAILTATVHLSTRELDVSGNVYFLFDPKATQTILDATDKKLSP